MIVFQIAFSVVLLSDILLVSCMTFVMFLYVWYVPDVVVLSLITSLYAVFWVIVASRASSTFQCLGTTGSVVVRMLVSAFFTFF